MKKYEYKCPECGNVVEYENKFCNECSCKLNWDEEETIKENEFEVKSIKEKEKRRY